MEKEYNIKVYQGYGMTETSPMISLNTVKNNKIGSVGKLLRHVDIKFNYQDEILVKTPSLMLGYLSEVDEFSNHLELCQTNKEWFATGDKGYMDGEGYLYIDGRISTEYKLSNGKYCNPQFIESLVLNCNNVDQAMVFSNKDNEYNEMLVYSTCHDRKKIILEIEKQWIGKLQKYEIPQKIYLMKEPFCVENDTLTLKLEHKRKKVKEMFLANKIFLY
jgi:long-chain acyl-CoA synthetase